MVRVSVITPTLDRANVLVRALDSVQSQTFGDLEHVVIDGGSTDGTVELLEEYADARVPVRAEEFTDEPGVGAARNRGLELATGEFIAFLDSDDEYVPECLATTVCALEGTDYVGATNRHLIVDRTGVTYPSRTPVGEITPSALREGNAIGTPSSTTFRRSVLDEVGGFDPDIPSAEDYELYLRVLECGPMLGLPDHLLRYYRQDDSMTADPESKATAQRLLWEKHGDRLSEGLRARQAYSLAHSYAVTGRMTEARRLFGRSLRGRPSPLTAYHYVLAALGKGPFDAGMYLKRRCYGVWKRT